MDSWVRKNLWGRDELSTPVFLGFPVVPAGKESACNMADLGSIPGLGRSPGEGNVYPLLYYSLENSMDCVAHGVTMNQTGLRNFQFEFIIDLNTDSYFRKNFEIGAEIKEELVVLKPNSF